MGEARMYAPSAHLRRGVRARDRVRLGVRDRVRLGVEGKG